MQKVYRRCTPRCTEGVQKVYRRNVQKNVQRRFECEKKAACALTGWLHAQTQGTGSKVSLSGWSSDIHIVVSVQRPDSSERPTMGVPVHILLEKPLLKAFCTSAKGLLYIR